MSHKGQELNHQIPGDGDSLRGAQGRQAPLIRWRWNKWPCTRRSISRSIEITSWSEALGAWPTGVNKSHLCSLLSYLPMDSWNQKESGEASKVPSSHGWNNTLMSRDWALAWTGPFVTGIWRSSDSTHSGWKPAACWRTALCRGMLCSKRTQVTFVSWRTCLPPCGETETWSFPAYSLVVERTNAPGHLEGAPETLGWEVL